MAQNDTGNVAYQRGQELKITKRTVSFRNNVYQFKNITGFSAGELGSINKIMLFISLFFILTFFPASFAALYQKQIEIGAAFFILTAFFLWIAALSRKKKYGLILTINSGDRHMFVTSDHKTLSEVIQQLYTFMESDKDGTYLYYQQ